MTQFKLITEGVLVIASSNSLKKEYENKEFDYNFPAGINELISQNSIIAITNSGGDNIIAEYDTNKEIKYSDYDKVIEQSIEFSDNDELLILSHSEFTMICDKDGNYKNYGFPITFSEPIEKGKYIVEIAVNDVSEEFEVYKAYFKIIINLKPLKGEKIENFICELCEQ